MRATVFNDVSLGRQAGRFVWLAWNTENARMAALKKTYAVQALPTLLVVDPASEKAVLRWVGGATLPQLLKILDDGEKAFRGRAAAGLDEVLARADRAYASGDNAAAATAYRDVLAKAPPGWKGYARAVESLLFALVRTDDAEACARTARDAFPKLKRTPSAANIAASGLGCALELKPEAPEREALVAALAAAARQVVADRKTKIAADDRSGVFEMLVQERDMAKDEAGKKAVAAEWAAFLEGEAAKMKTPDGRAVFDPHRLSAYMEMGAPEKAVPMLLDSERDLPADYNPAARLAVAYWAMGKLDEALAASDRALSKVHGPRKLRVLGNRADIHAARGDTAAAKKTLDEAIALAESLPEGQRSDGTIAALKKKREAM